MVLNNKLEEMKSDSE